MNGISPQIHEEIVENWDNFLWKLDYIFYVLFSENENVRQICFKKVNDNYIVYSLNEMSETAKTFECENFPISEDDLFNYLMIDKYISFSYKTKIFNKENFFIGQKSLILNDELIVLSLKYLNNNNFKIFNSILENYELFNLISKKYDKIMFYKKEIND